LRGFLGFTFLYAGLSKILDRHYLNAGSPLGVRSQMLHAAVGSPIGPLVMFSAHHAALTGLLIAFGEIAAGLGTLLGMYPRLAAGVGMLLALSFFLTVSWRTSPYYVGADIVFVFAWMPILLSGHGGLFTITSYLRRRSRVAMRLAPVPLGHESPALRARVDRRTAVSSGVLAGAIGLVVLFGGSALALARRPRTGTGKANGSGSATAKPTAPGGGTTIAAVSDVAVGDAKNFTAPDGGPAWLLHPTNSTFTAFSAICTHQGCPVQWARGGFQCPCHGATYDANGQVTGGPAPAPLTPIPVTVANGQVRTT
jgi:thiosulfate dehydrogenase [quinone] large subunit